MIEINLLPQELKKKEGQFKKIDLSKLNLQDLPILKIVVAAFGGLIALQVLLFLIGVYAKVNLSSLNKRFNHILPEKKEAEALKAQVDTINKKMSAIDELMVKRFSWAKKLSDLNDSMTPGIWLVELDYDEKLTERPMQISAKAPKGLKDEAGSQKPIMEKVVLKYLLISGYASSMGEEGTALIGKFIKSLRENPGFYSDFSDIELGSIKRDKIEDQEVMSFKITCLFKETR